MTEIKSNIATDAQVKQWKQRWGEVHQFDVTIDDDGNTVTGYFRKPNLEVIGASISKGENDPIGSGNVLFENCWLGGDDRIKSDDEARLSCALRLNRLFKLRAVEVKKL